MNERFLKGFLTVNIVALTGFFLWGYILPLFNMGADLSAMREMEVTPPEVKIENPPPREAGNDLVGPLTYTVDATHVEEWVFFDFSSGSIVPAANWDSPNWDLAIRRTKILTNGGATNPRGNGAVLRMEGIGLEGLAEAPESGYVQDEKPDNAGELANPHLDKWYNYNYWTHRLIPKEEVYVIRTADGKYAKMAIRDYYCGQTAGCLSFTYVYQGDGSRNFISNLAKNNP
jgi:hypothetical protein